MATIYDFSARDIDGKERSLADYREKTLLVVNVASRCGFTPQYKGLEQLQRQFAAQGLTVLGFPCDQFGHQEPGDEAEIRQFCSTTYDVSFPMFGKVEVNGADAHPLYKWLKHEARGVLGTEGIKWNFTKFLVDRDGRVVRRYGPADTPEKIARDLPAVLG
jgi:glutathione peroxidase